MNAREGKAKAKATRHGGGGLVGLDWNGIP